MKKTKILLLPGLDGTGILFNPFLKECPSEFLPTVIRYPENEAHSYKALEKIVMSKIPIDDKFLILGESFSGPIALSIAAQNPPNLLGVVLVASFIHSPVPTWLKIIPFDILSKVPVPSFVMLHWLMDNKKNPELFNILKEALNQLKPNVKACRYLHPDKTTVFINLLTCMH